MAAFWAATLGYRAETGGLTDGWGRREVAIDCCQEERAHAPNQSLPSSKRWRPIWPEASPW
jgi:hypothetical protein